MPVADCVHKSTCLSGYTIYWYVYYFQYCIG